MIALKLPSTLLHEHADDCLSRCLSGLSSSRVGRVDLDASSLHEFDSSALAVLLGLRREVLARGGQLHIAGMTSRLRELASLYGVLDLLEHS